MMTATTRPGAGEAANTNPARGLTLCILSAVGCCVIALPTWSETVFVDAEATGLPEDGTTWDRAYRTIQSAIDGSESGDTIWIASGVYEETIHLQPNIQLVGGFLPGDAMLSDRAPAIQITTIDASMVAGPRHVATGADGAVLDGLVLTGGDAFTDQVTNGSVGGGLFLAGGSMMVTRCTFVANDAAERGGGAYISNAIAVFEDCTFETNNATTAGGAIAAVNSMLTLTRCQILENQSGGGAGVFLSGGSGAFSRVLFQANTGGLGGGLYALSNATADLTNCIFDRNEAVAGGGGIYNSSATVSAAFCTLSDNSANNGSALTNFGITEVSDSILWNNASSPIQHGGISISVTSSIVEGGYPGTGNLDADPRFRFVADPAPFPLTWDSPARDAATGIPPDVDYAGRMRPTGVAADAGALEFGVDSDGGGLPDDFETANNLESGNPDDDSEDTDEDGLTNLEEFRRGSDINDADDPPSTFYVNAENGSDEFGDGSTSMPWQTIPFAFTQIPEGTPNFKIRIILSAGDYSGKFTIPPYVTLGGESSVDRDLVRIFHREVDANFTIVTGAEGACLKNCSVSVDGSVLGNVELLRIEDVSMRVEHVYFDGLTNADSIGIAVSGPGSSGSAIRDSVVRRVREGVRAVNSGAVVTRSLFEQIQGTALLIELPENGKGAITPQLGDTTQGETTGFNQFREISGMFINYANDNSTETLAQYNDWGLDDPDAVQERVAAQVMIKPIISKRIGPGTLVVDVLDDTTANQIPISTEPRVVLDSGPLTPPDEESQLFIYLAVAPGSHSVEARANVYHAETVNVDTPSLSIEYLAMSLERTAPPEDVDGLNGVNAVDVQLVINGALGIDTNYNTDVNGSGATDAIDVQIVINAVLTQ